MNSKEQKRFQRASREAQLLDTQLGVPGYAEKLHACMTAQKESTKPIRELAMGERAYTANWAFNPDYDCWKPLCCPAERYTATPIQRTGRGFVFLGGDKRGTEITA